MNVKLIMLNAFHIGDTSVDEERVAGELEHIAEQIRLGFTSGFIYDESGTVGTWEITQ